MPLNCSYLKHTSLLQSYVFSPLHHLAEEGLWGASLPPGLSPLMALIEQQVGEQSGAKSALFPACLPSLHTHFACDQQGWKQLGDLGLSLVQPSAPSLLLQQTETFTKAILLCYCLLTGQPQPGTCLPTTAKGYCSAGPLSASRMICSHRRASLQLYDLPVSTQDSTSRPARTATLRLCRTVRGHKGEE